jgi:signal transduction histidine kinase
MNTEKIKNRLFTLYQRFHSHVEGKGLGLYLVKSQLEALGGSLAVESEENKGTTFVISIPIQNPKKALN